MVNAIRPSISGLNAASTALGISASNIANMRSSAPLDRVEISPAARAATARAARGDDEVFKPLQTTNVSVAEGGVRAVVREKTPSHVVAFDPNDPNDPNADEDGLVAEPNVDLANEMVGMKQARSMYLANLAAIRTEDEMAGELIDSFA